MNSSSPFLAPINPLQWRHCFLETCINGDLSHLQYLCQSQFLHLSSLHSEDEKGFRYACHSGHLEIIKFLTTCPTLRASGHSFVSIHERQEQGLHSACTQGYLDIVQFLMTSPDLLEAGHTFPDIHIQDDAAFKSSCTYHHWNVVEWLLFDFHLPLTPRIESILRIHPQTYQYLNILKERQTLRNALPSSDLPPLTLPSSYRL